MTKKHYKAIAEIISYHSTEGESCGCIREPLIIISEFLPDLADYFASENPRFDRERFLIACGVK